MAGKFECYTDKAGEYRFRLKASNGNTILSSEGYKSKSGCTNGIASVQKNCLDEICSANSRITNPGQFFKRRFMLFFRSQFLTAANNNLLSQQVL